MIENQESALQVVKKILAADFACAEGDFDKAGVSFHLCREIEGARRFPLPEKFLAVVTMGSGVVVSCSAERLQWARTYLINFTPDELFYAPAVALMVNLVTHDNQTMFGPELKYICTSDTFKPHSTREDIELSIINEEAIRQLYENNRFSNALGRQYNPRRPTLLACSAKCDGVIAGLAGASADTDSMWQIGIDTLPEYRNRGIGKALVSRLTEALFDIGKLPYYSTGTTNIPSRRIAISLGYRPAWVEIYSREPVPH
jgi:GNAT superfamily N-acetyltransferase